MRRVADRSLDTDLEIAQAVFALPDWEAAGACTGLARDFFALRHVQRTLHRARGAGNDLNSWTARVDGDAVALEMVIPKRFKMERTLWVTRPVVDAGRLADFTFEGVPLAEVVQPLGLSIDGRAAGWATKMPLAGAQLQLWFIDAGLASGLPNELPRRPPLIPMPSDSGVVITKDGSRFTMTEVSSTRRIGRKGFICEMIPKMPRPRIGFDDPGEPRTLGPDPSVLAVVDISRGDPQSSWFRFEVTDPIERRIGVVHLAAAHAATADLRPLGQLLDHPLAKGAKAPVTASCKPYGLTNATDLAARIAGAVVLLKEIKARDVSALNPANRIATTRSVAELVATMNEETLSDLLHRGLSDL